MSPSQSQELHSERNLNSPLENPEMRTVLEPNTNLVEIRHYLYLLQAIPWEISVMKFTLHSAEDVGEVA